MKVETTDIYFSAYLMVKGVTLHSMNIRNGGRRQKIIFSFSGNGDLARLNREFQAGQALVNPIELKKSILHLKDLMYDKLRTYQEERRFNDANQQGRDRGREAVQ